MTSPSVVTFAPVRRVAVVGGVHGNEMSGIFLVRHWLKDAAELQRPSFSVMPLIANQLAVERGVRYIDMDLNRSFLPGHLELDREQPLPHEVLRAREVNGLLGPRDSDSAVGLVIDLHNTTANTGDCVIINNSEDHFSTHLAASIQRTGNTSRCRVLDLALTPENKYCLSTVGHHGLGIELGPQPQGVVRAENVARMRKIVHSALDFVELFNQGVEFPECDLEIFRMVRKIDFPRDADGNLNGFIHPDREGQDWKPVYPGQPLFQTLCGETVLYDGPCALYPLFINEAAYYEKGTALCWTERQTISLPRLQRDSSAP